MIITKADVTKGESLARASLIDPTAELLKRHKISQDEYKLIIEILERAPTMTELGIFSAMWSEHCSYKSSRIHLKRFPTTGPQVVVGPGENAGVVRLKDKLCIAFKMESHNHPSFIEPYQGAATGVGGILRDVFCMGARPIANLNCLRFGDRALEKTKFLVPRVVKGIGDYGNCVGVPTVGGSVSYDKSYDGNCLVNAMTVGLIEEDKIFKGFATGLGNLVLYVGSATGRDGIHGATMASDEFAGASTSKTTIQVGDPFAEKKLLEATLEVLSKNLVVGIQDMGAAGLTSSGFEMAGRAGNGVFIDLDRVPTRRSRMTAYEIMLSESQERMLMVVEPKHLPEIYEILVRWGLSHDVIGTVTDSGRFVAVKNGIKEIDVPVAPLTEKAPIYQKPLAPRSNHSNEESAALKKLREKLDQDVNFFFETMLNCLKDQGDKSPIYSQYDRHVGTRTVLCSEDDSAGVLWIKEGKTVGLEYLGVGVDAGCAERKVKNNPFLGGSDAVLVRARHLAAAGVKPLAVTDCLNFGSADDSVVMREFSDAVDGISKACRELQIPVVSGNVSLYNTTDGRSIHPTPMIGVVGVVEDVRICKPATLVEKTVDNIKIYLLSSKEKSTSYENLAATAAAKVANIEAVSGSIPEIDWTSERNVMGDLLSFYQNASKKFFACRDVGSGGVVAGLVKLVYKLKFDRPTLNVLATTGSHLLTEGGPRYLLATSDKIDFELFKNSRLQEIAQVQFNGKNLLQFQNTKFELSKIFKEMESSQLI